MLRPTVLLTAMIAAAAVSAVDAQVRGSVGSAPFRQPPVGIPTTPPVTVPTTPPVTVPTTPPVAVPAAPPVSVPTTRSGNPSRSGRPPSNVSRSWFSSIAWGAGHRRPAPVCSYGFGTILFDPYWLWTSDAFDASFYPNLAAPVAAEDRPVGGLQLDVEPRRALVYVDGWFVGIVDTFSGYYHHLDLAAGPHRVEFLASGYDPLSVDVFVPPGRTETYRGALNRR